MLKSLFFVSMLCVLLCADFWAADGITGVTVITHGFDPGFKSDLPLDMVTDERAKTQNAEGAAEPTMAQGWRFDFGVAILGHVTRGNLWVFHAETGEIELVPDIYFWAMWDKIVRGHQSTFVRSSTTGEQVILVDWRYTSSLGNYTGIGGFAGFRGSETDSGVHPRGFAEATAHSVYSMLFGGCQIYGANVAVPPFLHTGSNQSTLTWDAVNGQNRQSDVPIHLIGHSFGTVVTSELAQRIGYLAGTEVDQVTFLDPHDWDQGSIAVDGETLHPDAKSWANVRHVDNYFQDVPILGTNPQGRRVKGAQNANVADMDAGMSLSAFHGFSSEGTLSSKPHSRVHSYYYGTLVEWAIGSTINGYWEEIPEWSAWYGTSVVTGADYKPSANQTGFAFSRLGGSRNQDLWGSWRSALATYLPWPAD